MKKVFIIAIAIFATSTMLTSCQKEEIEAPASSTKSSCEPNCQSVQCYGTTQSGARCKNMTKNCCGFCYQHK
jgi:hypothetical protein